MAIPIGIAIVFARRRDHCCWRTAASRAVTQLTTKVEPRACNCNLFNPMALALVTRQHSNGPAIRRASIRFLMHETNVLVAHAYGSKGECGPSSGGRAAADGPLGGAALVRYFGQRMGSVAHSWGGDGTERTCSGPPLTVKYTLMKFALLALQ